MPKRYAESLIEDIAYHAEWKWADAELAYERPRSALRSTLVRADKWDLIARLDEASGIKPHREPYLERIYELIGLDNSITWSVLSRVLGREEKTIKQYLYQRRCAETVRLLDDNSKGV